MPATVETLIAGSAELDRMKNEIIQVTNILFWLTENNPKNWLKHSLYQNQHGWDFKTQFGSIEESGTVWEVWRNLGGFRTRCVHRPSATSQLFVAHTTAPREEKVLTQTPKLLDVVSDMGLAGIIVAHDHLNVFVTGMMSEFPLQTKVEPYLEAARRVL